MLVPATLSRDYAAARRLAFSVDPTAGYTFGDLSAVPRTDEEGQRRAQERLDEQLLQLIQAGASPTGEVGDSDPLAAIAAVLARSDFDEILLSTLPASASRWVRMDLPGPPRPPLRRQGRAHPAGRLIGCGAAAERACARARRA